MLPQGRIWSRIYGIAQLIIIGVVIYHAALAYFLLVAFKYHDDPATMNEKMDKVAYPIAEFITAIIRFIFNLI